MLVKLIGFSQVVVLVEYLKEFNFVSVVVRLLLAMASGAAIGYGRAKKSRNAGLRTYMLVSTGAALTILVSLYENQMLYGQWAWAADLAEFKFDGTRYAAQVINGIGFLAAGTIIGSSHQQVSGLTSAIGLFTAAALGIAAGSGFYECVIPALFIIILAMDVMSPLEVSFKRRLRNITIYVEFQDIEDISRISDTITGQGAKIFDIDIECSERTVSSFPSAVFSMKMSRERSSHSEMLSSVAELPCVYAIQELIS